MQCPSSQSPQDFRSELRRARVTPSRPCDGRPRVCADTLWGREQGDDQGAPLHILEIPRARMSFYTAARDGQVQLLKDHLLNGADVHQRFNNDRTALHFA